MPLGEVVFAAALATFGVVSLWARIALPARRARARMAFWREAAAEAGVTDLGSLGDGVLSGSADPFQLRFTEYVEGESRGTRLQIWGKRLAPGCGSALSPPGRSWAGATGRRSKSATTLSTARHRFRVRRHWHWRCSTVTCGAACAPWCAAALMCEDIGHSGLRGSSMRACFGSTCRSARKSRLARPSAGATKTPNPQASTTSTASTSFRKCCARRSSSGRGSRDRKTWQRAWRSG